jgi:hypothetical protein
MAGQMAEFLPCHHSIKIEALDEFDGFMESGT